MSKLMPWMLLASMLFAGACGSSEEEAAPAAEPQEVATEPAVAEGDPSDEELPVPEDFEAEAEAEINAENFAEELDSLAAEIESDG